MNAVIDFLQGNLQFIITTAIAVAAVVVSVLVPMRQRTIKRLDYTMLWRVPLVPQAGRAAFSDRLTVLYEGQPIAGAYSTSIQIRNTGRQEVLAADYADDGGIQVSFDDFVTIDAFITDASSPAVADHCEILEYLEADHSGFLVTPELLNPGEWLNLTVVTSRRPTGLRVACRFPGQQRPMRAVVEEAQKQQLRFAIVSLPVMIAMLALTFVIAPENDDTEVRTRDIVIITLLFIGAAVYAYFMFRHAKRSLQRILRRRTGM